ncbi:hypothetical protein [Dehalobacterium formicoaceticum]|uniref:Uncharacterized protein n=1 Tax=Dehalobacterium formicoaceticum TaxID=51515 RepID=A0ABT1Y3S4_9FIRM|nr:hypothetical protein [Dehalobacterium formicoaceticum]MCR6545520.1 hypothetical protein [Dehalobacterium formicoaceticum]
MIVSKKGLMPILFAFIIILTSNIANASSEITEAEAEMQPFWQNISDVTVNLSITNGKAELAAAVDGYQGVNKITAVAVLERLNSNGTYTEIARWDNIRSDTRYLNWTSTRYVAKGYTYRFKFIATAYKDGVGETVSASKSAKAY